MSSCGETTSAGEAAQTNQETPFQSIFSPDQTFTSKETRPGRNSPPFHLTDFSNSPPMCILSLNDAFLGSPDPAAEQTL
jgi:hypothetical protein